jgi:activator of HSP90 ATPase
MPKTIRQSVTLSASAERLYAMYLDPKAHAAITGSPVKVSARPGAKFSAYGGSIWGTTLATIPGRLIVQSWRSVNFGDQDPDSVLILAFTPVGKKEGRIDLIHANVADQDVEGVRKGWKKFYWTPWKKYLAGPEPAAPNLLGDLPGLVRHRAGKRPATVEEMDRAVRERAGKRFLDETRR